MNITPEQYYWYIKRPQMLRQYVAGCGEETEYEKFQKTHRKETDYFHFGVFENYDWNTVAGRYPVAPDVGCTAVRYGNMMGRNLDYYYDYSAEFLISSLNTPHKFSSIAVVQHPQITENDIMTESETYRTKFKALPFAVMDGMNKYGVVTEQNMLPIGDNPDHPNLLNTYENGEWTYHKYWNRTFHTASKDKGLKRVCIPLIQRIVLDTCKSVEEAVETITQKYDWYSFFGTDPNPDYRTAGLELHHMISDKDYTIIVEFVSQSEEFVAKSDNISDIVIHWFKKQDSSDAFRKFKVERYRDGIQVPTTQKGIGTPAIMTNFYITGWNGSTMDFNKIQILNGSLTRYSIGTHRYAVMNSNYELSGNNMLSYMKLSEYDNAYKDGSKPEERDEYHGNNGYDNIWASEFTDPLGLIEGHPEYNNGIHIGTMYDNIKDVCEKQCDVYHECWNNKIRHNSTEPGCPWITVNRSVYDIENKTLSVVVQQEGLREGNDLSVHTYNLF